MELDTKKTDRRNLILLAIAKYISGFASYIYDVGMTAIFCPLGFKTEIQMKCELLGYWIIAVCKCNK